MAKRNERVAVTIKNFPPELKDNLMREASGREETLNDLVVAKLADHFGMKFEPVGRAQREVGASRDLYLVMPLKLHQRIKHRATDRRCWPRELMIDALAA